MVFKVPAFTGLCKCCQFRLCLEKTVEFADGATVQCPFDGDDYQCSAVIQDREVKAVSCGNEVIIPQGVKKGV